MSGQQSSIAVPDTGTREVETKRIENPDGSIVARQVIDPLIALDITNIRKLVEKFFVFWTSERPIITPSGRELKLDMLGNLKVAANPSIFGGVRVARLIAAGSTNATVVKNSRGNVYGWHIYNAAAAVRFLKLYNTAKKPNVGVDTPVMTVPLPAGAAANVFFETGVDEFTEGISYATTVNAIDSDATALTAGDLIINLLWV